VLAAQQGLPLVQARVFNLVGPGLQDRHLPAVLAARLAAIARGLAPGELATGPLEATRDFVDVRDAADALVLLALAPVAPPLVNVASGVETPVKSVLDALVEASGVTGLRVTTRTPDRPVDVPRAVADVGLLRRLGWRPRFALEESLSDMVSYFRAFPST
jgi:nucleoside-diphosphate-sugar epimerase